MKKSEKNALKNAFGIPESEHKDEFLAEYSRRLESRRSPVPVFIKYTAAAAFAAVIISIGIMHLPSPDKEFTASEVITDVTTSFSGTEPTDTLTNGAVVTSDTSKASTVQTAETTITVTTTASETTDKSSSATDSASATTANTTNSTSSSRTTAAKTTTTKHTVSTTTTKAADIPETTLPPVTTTVIASELPLTEGPSPRDYTVKPSLTYDPDEPEINDGDGFPGKPPTSAVPAMSSDTIIYGKVIRRYYTSFDDRLYTQIDVRITDSYRSGYLREGDCITVYIRGGFVKTHKGTYVRDLSGFIPEINEDYLLMLNTSDSRYPSGTFVLSEPSDESAFTYDGSNFISAVNRNIRYSYSDMKQLIL